MKILLCHNYYQQAGGEDQVFADESWLLESRGHEVVRYTLHNDALDRMGPWEAARKTLWNRQSYRELRELVRRHRPDVMHCHNTFPLISPSACAAAGAERVPVVQTLHNYRLLCPSGLFFRNGRACEDCLGKFLAWPAVAHACYRGNRRASAVVAMMLALHRLRGTWTRRVSRYIALSDFSRRKFVEGGLPAERIAVKPNFIRCDPGAGDGYPLAGGGGYALFVGRLAPEKGTETLLAAWRQLHDPMPLKIVGDGPLGEQARAAAAGSPHVEFLGRRPPAEVLDLLGGAACLVLPSACYENCPKTLIEAFAKGTPVIASRLGAMAEMVDDGRTGLLFEPGSAADLAAKVRLLAVAGTAVQAMRRAAREEYQHKYTAESNYAALVAIYREAAGKDWPSSEDDWPASAGPPGIAPATRCDMRAAGAAQEAVAVEGEVE